MTWTLGAGIGWVVAAILVMTGCGRWMSSPPRADAALTRGAEVYAVACSACHQVDGRGSEGVGPPLVGSRWVSGSPDRLIRIVLHGVRGPIEVQGEVWNQEMPAMAFFGDQDLAAVLTFIRQAWGNRASAAAPTLVAEIRLRTADQRDSWTADELLRLP